MFKYLFLYIMLLSSMLCADFNTTILDKYHERLCNILVNSSDNIDNYFVEGSSIGSKTSAQLKTSYAIESERKVEYALRLRLHLSLPKIQKHLRLIFEDTQSDNLLNDGTSLVNEKHIQNINYTLKVEVSDNMIKDFNIKWLLGTRFRKSFLHPFMSMKAKRVLANDDMKTVVFNSRFRFFDDMNYEEVASINRMDKMKDNLYMVLENIFRYRSQTDNNELITRLTGRKLLGDKQELSTGMSIYSSFRHGRYDIIYPEVFTKYYSMFYKDWIYYEVSPAVLWRHEHNYRASLRVMFNLGVIFKKD